jgi:hypothetical protein
VKIPWNFTYTERNIEEEDGDAAKRTLRSEQTVNCLSCEDKKKMKIGVIRRDYNFDWDGAYRREFFLSDFRLFIICH